MKILVTSDNHLGFKEMDPVRADDSFKTLDEILSIAKTMEVDFVLQGGDLFHDNKPSRNTYNKAIQILKRHCLGDAKPRFTTNIKINTEDPNINVSLPIISIHGNHDDPSGFSSTSPLDILHSGGLINYIGKVADVDNIELHPVLIEGNKKIALYGMGHIKDRRVYNTFVKNRVRYHRPIGEDWLNILVVHQNRVLRHEEYLSEDFIDPFFDIVIYGHEHESVKIRHRNFDVIQCGSTVRTSLCDAEAGDKFVYIIDVGVTVNISRIKLQTVRPLAIDRIRVTGNGLEGMVEDKIGFMLQSVGGDAFLPLIRLIVDLDEVTVFNKHQILQYLDRKVANPGDALRIVRKTTKETTRPAAQQKKTEIEDIYMDLLGESDLKVISRHRVVEAICEFLNKDIKTAFKQLVENAVQDVMKSVSMDDLAVENIENAIKSARERLVREEAVGGAESSESVAEDIAECVTMSPPPASVSFHESAVNQLSKADFTFLEEKIENEREREIVDEIRKETVKRAKAERKQSESDLLDFDEYI